VAQFKKNSQVAACRADVKTVETAAEAYNATNGNYPSNVAQLVNGGYLKSTPSEPMTINQSNGDVTSSSCP
jgi:general secretion pathway protein G